jgi:integrase
MRESKKFLKVGQSLYRYGTEGSYYAIWKERGKNRKKKLKSSTQRNAKIEVNRLKEKYQKLKPKARSVSLLRAAENYQGTLGTLAKSTRERAGFIIDKLRVWPSVHKPILEITTTELLSWLTDVTKELSKDYYNKHLGVLRQIFEMALADGLIFESPLAKVKTLEPGDPERFTPTEEQAWAVIADVRAQKCNRDAQDSGDFIEFMLLSGLGNGEAAAIQWRDVDWKQNIIRVRRLKTQRNFEVPIFKSLADFLKRLPQGKPEDHLMTISSARRAIANSCGRLGLPPFTQRSFRRCFITRAVEKGVDFKTIAAWQGHRDGGVLIAKTYSHLRNDHSRAMADRL